MDSRGSTRFAQLDGVRIAYSDSGAGRPVVFAHGLTSSRAKVAAARLPDFDAVGRSSRLIAYDARGHGESEGTRSPDDYQWTALADDLLRLLDRWAPDVPVSAIGSSMGTGTILHAVLARPERFDRLVLTAPPTAWETRAPQAEVYEERADALEGLSPEEAQAYLSAGEPAPIFADARLPFSMPDVALDLLPTVLRGAGRSDLPERDSLRAIAHPTLVLAWATDPGHPVSTAERLRDLIPNSRLHVSTTSADIRTWGERAVAFVSSRDLPGSSDDIRRATCP